MSLRDTLGGDIGVLHRVVDDLLDRPDALIVLFDGDRAVSYVTGLGLSPCQSELVTIEIERVLRAAGGAARAPGPAPGDGRGRPAGTDAGDGRAGGPSPVIRLAARARRAR